MLDGFECRFHAVSTSPGTTRQIVTSYDLQSIRLLNSSFRRLYDGVELVVAFEAFELDIAWCSEADVMRRADCFTDRFADENLASVGLTGYPRCHGYVESEEIVTSSYRLTHVNAHAHPDLVPAFRVFAQRLLNANPTSHRLVGVGERDHEAVALILHDVAAVAFGLFGDQPVVSFEQFQPSSITQLFVARCGSFDIGEGDVPWVPRSRHSWFQATG